MTSPTTTSNAKRLSAEYNTRQPARFHCFSVLHEEASEHLSSAQELDVILRDLNRLCHASMEGV